MFSDKRMSDEAGVTDTCVCMYVHTHIPVGHTCPFWSILHISTQQASNITYFNSG